MNKSTTPRTDAEEFRDCNGERQDLILAGFARQLETELTAANKRVDELMELIESVKSHAIDVNDEFLQKLLEKL